MAIVNNDDEVVAASESDYATTGGMELVVENPSGTQQIAIDMLNQIAGYEYLPYKAVSALVPDTAELGDVVDIGLGAMSIIASQDIDYDGLLAGEISAPGEDETDNEFGNYKTKTERDMIRSVSNLAEKTASLTVGVNSITAEVRSMKNPDEEGSLADQIAKLEIKSDSIESSISTNYYTKDATDAAISTYVSNTITDTYIESAIKTKYETKTDAQAKLAEAKGYTNSTKATITTEYTTAIRQSQTDIQSSVGKTITKYDTSEFGTSAVVIQDYGNVTNSTQIKRYPPSEHNGEYYVNLNTGNCWHSNGTNWVILRENGVNKVLPTVQSSLSTRITQNSEGLNIEIQNRQNGDADTRLYVDATASSLRSEITGAYADEWSLSGADGYGYYYRENIVKVTGPNGVDYYRCTADHVASYSSQPPYGPWEVTNAPTVASMIDQSLKGITISYEGTTQANASYITLNKNGVFLGGGVVQMSNVQANTIAAGTSITSPYIYDSSANVRMTMDGSYPGPGVALSILNTQGQYYQFFKVLRSSGDTWFLFDGSTYLTFSSALGKFSCYGTWDFSSANVILPS